MQDKLHAWFRDQYCQDMVNIHSKENVICHASTTSHAAPEGWYKSCMLLPMHLGICTFAQQKLGEESFWVVSLDLCHCCQLHNLVFWLTSLSFSLSFWEQASTCWEKILPQVRSDEDWWRRRQNVNKMNSGLPELSIACTIAGCLRSRISELGMMSHPTQPCSIGTSRKNKMDASGKT